MHVSEVGEYMTIVISRAADVHSGPILRESQQSSMVSH